MNKEVIKDAIEVLLEMSEEEERLGNIEDAKFYALEASKLMDSLYPTLKTVH